VRIKILFKVPRIKIVEILDFACRYHLTKVEKNDDITMKDVIAKIQILPKRIHLLVS